MERYTAKRQVHTCAEFQSLNIVTALFGPKKPKTHRGPMTKLMQVAPKIDDGVTEELETYGQESGMRSKSTRRVPKEQEPAKNRANSLSPKG